MASSENRIGTGDEFEPRQIMTFPPPLYDFNIAAMANSIKRPLARWHG